MSERPYIPARLLTPYLIACALALAGWPALGQTSNANVPPAPKTARTSSPPAWNTLTASQQAALKPLAPVWSEISSNRKRKWIALSANFDKLSPAEQVTLHARMGEWATLSTVDRNRARLNFAETRTLSSAEKKAQWEAYQALSAEEKRKLAAQASHHTAVGAAPAVTARTRGKLAAVPVTRSDTHPPETHSPSGAHPVPAASAAAPSQP